jgi:HPt (histidine-containing phosphotransfer) domain-containing protein
LLAEIAGMVLNDLPTLTGNIRAAITAGNARDLEHAAHKLKGSIGILHADAAVALTQQLEDLGRSAQLAGSEILFTQLEQALAELADTLRALPQPETTCAS